MRQWIMGKRGGVRLGLLCATIGLSLVGPGQAPAQGIFGGGGQAPSLEITPGDVKAFRTAVLRFRQVGRPVGDERVGGLRDEIEAGLAFSSVVQPLARDAYLGPEESTPLALKLGFDCDTWRQSGADALVQGELSRDGARLKAEMRIWDIARCRELRTGSVVGDRDRMDAMGRRIADEIVEALTGLRGVSSTEIAFVSDRTGTREVYVMSADGRNQRPATRSDRIKLFPDWLPDGRAILYVSYDGLQPGFFITSRSDEIRPGPILRQLLPGLPKYRGRFDPSGEELAMVASVDGAAEIFRVKRRGTDTRRLTRHPAIDISPSWSPDGREIVFCSDRTGSPQLYVMDRDGGNLRRLTYTGAYNASPVWSPDGRWIAYESRVRGQFDIWLIDPAGQVNFPIIQHPKSDEAPSWSPDGRQIVFSSQRRGRFDLYVTDWNGDNPRRLTGRTGQNLQPAWGPQVR
jgi:TolB protein